MQTKISASLPSQRSLKNEVYIDEERLAQLAKYEENVHVHQYDNIAQSFVLELLRAKKLHGPKPFNSLHEGYAVILEEVDEVWDEIKKKVPNKDFLRKELTQVAAMCLRFIHYFTYYMADQIEVYFQFDEDEPVKICDVATKFVMSMEVPPNGDTSGCNIAFFKGDKKIKFFMKDKHSIDFIK